MKSKKVFCFGELLLRFSPALQGQWIKTQSMPVHVGGAELNVAKALAKWQAEQDQKKANPELAKLSDKLDSNN